MIQTRDYGEDTREEWRNKIFSWERWEKETGGTYICVYCADLGEFCDALQTLQRCAFRMYAVGMYLMWQLCVANARYLGVSTI